MPTAPQVSSQFDPRFSTTLTNIGGGADVDLEALSGLPGFGPQEILVHNTTGAQVAFEVVKLEGTVLSLTLEAGERLSLRNQSGFTLFDASEIDTGIDAICYWRLLGDARMNP